YARTGQIEGVYCTDSSALERFFSHRYFFIKSPYRLRKGATIVHRVAIASLWKKDHPEPEDLLKQLQQPLQLTLLEAHTELQSAAFPISPTHVVSSPEFVRKPWTVESVAATFGLSASNILKTMQSVRQGIGQAKRRVDKKGRRKARRPK